MEHLGSKRSNFFPGRSEFVCSEIVFSSSSANEQHGVCILLQHVTHAMSSPFSKALFDCTIHMDAIQGSVSIKCALFGTHRCFVPQAGKPDWIIYSDASMIQNHWVTPG